METTFKIHGVERRATKKKVRLLKRYTGTFWYHWQVSDVLYAAYCHQKPLPKEKAQENYNRCLQEIDELERLLVVPYVA